MNNYIQVYSEIKKELTQEDHGMILKDRTSEEEVGERDLRPLSQRVLGD